MILKVHFLKGIFTQSKCLKYLFLPFSKVFSQFHEKLKSIKGLASKTERHIGNEREQTKSVGFFDSANPDHEWRFYYDGDDDRLKLTFIDFGVGSPEINTPLK